MQLNFLVRGEKFTIEESTEGVHRLHGKEVNCLAVQIIDVYLQISLFFVQFADPVCFIIGRDPAKDLLSLF